jgi:hypothetical protein
MLKEPKCSARARSRSIRAQRLLLYRDVNVRAPPAQRVRSSKQCAAIVSSREQAINLFFKRSTRTRSHCAMISMVARRSVSRSG